MAFGSQEPPLEAAVEVLKRKVRGRLRDYAQVSRVTSEPLLAGKSTCEHAHR